MLKLCCLKITKNCTNFRKLIKLRKSFKIAKIANFHEIAKIWQKISKIANIGKKIKICELHKFSKISDIAHITRGHGSEKNFSLVRLRLYPEAPFYWKFLKIGMRSTKDIRKDVTISEFWGFAPAPPIPSLFRVVLLHQSYGCVNLCISPYVYM